MGLFNFNKNSKITVDEIRRMTSEIINKPKVNLNVSEEELYKASRIQVKAYHYNFDFGYQGIYELLEDEFCDKSTALIFYWLNQPLYYLQNPDSKNPIHDDGRKLKEYLENRITKGEFKEILQFVPIAFIDGPMYMTDDLNAKEKYLNEIPLDLYMPVGMNFSTTGTCNEINRYLNLSGIETLYCFDLVNTSDVKKIKPEDSLQNLNLCFNGYIRTKPKYAKISDLLHLTNLKSLRFDFYVRFKELEKLSEFKSLTHLKINVEKEDYSILSSLSSLKSLEFTSSVATDLSIVDNMSQLERLVITGCVNLTDIKGLSKMTNLRFLKIELTKKLKKLDGIFDLDLHTLIFKEVLISSNSFKGLDNMNIEILQLDCKSLKHVDFIPKRNLKELNLYNHDKNVDLLKKISEMDLSDCKIVERNWNNAL